MDKMLVNIACLSSVRPKAIAIAIAIAIAMALTISCGETVLAQGPLQAFQADLARAIAKAESSVVAIARVRRGSAVAPTDPNFIPQQYATGVVIDSNKVLTAYHTLGAPALNDYWVWHHGAPYQVTRVDRPKAADPWMDLAVLQLETNNLKPIKMGDGTKLKKGHVVIALGNPYAIARDGEVSASMGIVSNLNRKAPPIPGQKSRETLHQLGTLLQLDARLPRGASGGALIDIDGEMVGLTLSFSALAEEEADAGFAIPVNPAFRRAVSKLKAGQVDSYGYLGVLPSPLPLAERREGRRGVLVQNVMPGTAAAISGLRRLDLISAVNGESIEGPNELIRRVSSLRAGEKLQLTVLRGESQRRINRNVTLSKKRVAGELPVLQENQPSVWRGAQVEYMTAMPEYPFHAYKIDAQGCVGLLSVEEGSPVWQAGFRSGDYVSHVDGGRVMTPAEFYAAVNKASDDSVVLRRPPARGKPAEEVSIEREVDVENNSADKGQNKKER